MSCALNFKGVKEILLIREVEYAIMILDELNKAGSLSASELSKRRNIPSPFIYKVLKKLEAADILTIRRGAQGGYTIKGDCSKMSLYDIISAFENTFLVIECMKPEYDCSRNKESRCGLHGEFGRIQATLKKEFKSKSLKSLFEED